MLYANVSFWITRGKQYLYKLIQETGMLEWRKTQFHESAMLSEDLKNGHVTQLPKREETMFLLGQ